MNKKEKTPEKMMSQSLRRKVEAKKEASMSKEPPSTDDFIKCEICKHKFTDPRSLQCMHAFCRKCLTSYISDSTGKSVSSEHLIRCPLCQQTTDVPKGANPKSPETWPDYLPRNNFLISYLEALGLKEHGRTCDTCRRQNRKSDAKKWCSTCHDTLCDECVNFHNALKTTTQHKLIELSVIRRQPIKEIISAPLCQDHPGETVSKYCEVHKLVLCEKCIASSHKGCKDVKLLKDSARKVKPDAKHTTEVLLGETKLAKAIYNDRSQEERSIGDTQTDLLQRIQAVRQKINENLAKCEVEIVGELYDKQAKEKATIQKEMKETQMIRKSVSKIHGLSHNASEFGSDSHLLQTAPDADRESDHYKKQLASLNDRIKHTKIDFIVDPTLQKLMNGVSRLGELRVHTSSAEIPTDSKLKVTKQTVKVKSDSDPEDEIDVISVGRKSIRNGQLYPHADLASSFNGKTSTDYAECWFTGVAFLPDDKVVLVDRNNNKIKIFGKDLQLFTETSLQHQPFGIAIMSDFEIAVSIPRENKIEILTIAGTTLTPSRTVRTSDRCYGISYAGDRFATVLSCAKAPSIQILGADGGLRQDVCPEDSHLLPMFLRPWYVKMDRPGNTLYITDCHRSELTCISGAVLKRYMYKNETMNSPRGLAILPDGRAIVCGFGSDNIQLIDADGGLVGDLLVRNDGIMGPQEVALNVKADRLVVTFDPSSGESDTVKVYKIQV